MATISIAFALPAAAQTAAPLAEDFALTAAFSNTFEIESSQAAMEKTKNIEVSEFAETMIRDHTAAGEELQAAADEAEVVTPVPETLDARHEEMLEQLNTATGAEFDRLYIEMQVQAHQDAVDLFRSYAEQGHQEPLRDFAASTLPTLEEHLEQARELEQQASE